MFMVVEELQKDYPLQIFEQPGAVRRYVNYEVMVIESIKRRAFCKSLLPDRPFRRAGTGSSAERWIQQLQRPPEG